MSPAEIGAGPVIESDQQCANLIRGQLAHDQNGVESARSWNPSSSTPELADDALPTSRSQIIESELQSERQKRSWLEQQLRDAQETARQHEQRAMLAENQVKELTNAGQHTDRSGIVALCADGILHAVTDCLLHLGRKLIPAHLLEQW